MSEGRPSRMSRVIRAIDRATVGVAMLAVAVLLVDIGWIPTLSGEVRRLVVFANGLVVCLFLFEYFAKLALSQPIARHLRANLFDTTITGLFLLLLLFAHPLYHSRTLSPFFESRQIALSRLIVWLALSYIVITLISKAVAYQKQMTAAKFQPAGIVIGSFVLVIALGTALLSSPEALSTEARAREGRMHIVDAVFTSTSAVCVTGLVVKDTGTHFSTFGQVVILCLIQVGGLGLMTFVAFSSLLLGKGIPIYERVVMQDVLSYELMKHLPKMVIFILLVTLTTEAAGALLLYGTWAGDYTTGQRVYMSVFHAVSAYCNAGFSLMSDSFVKYGGSWPVVGTITGLIIFGGAGFTVQEDILRKLWRVLTRKSRTRGRLLKNLSATPAPAHLSLHSKTVIVTSGILLSAGAMMFALLEWNGVLSGLPAGEKALAAWFQSVTPRTAGFNTVDFSVVRASTLMVTMALMFVGASSGGTGGGIKTSTFAVVVATLRATLRNRLNVEMLRRTIPIQTIRQALAVVFMAALAIAVGTAILTLSEPGIEFQKLLFEEVSAFGTVGLSTGTAGTPLSLSASLSWVGKLVIIVTMLTGRIGALAMLMVVAQKSAAFDYEYPSERVTVG